MALDCSLVTPGLLQDEASVLHSVHLWYAVFGELVPHVSRKC
jgi:hypothetical protein